MPVNNYQIFQQRAHAWAEMCFGRAIVANVRERCYRFLEEALELVQSKDCTREECHRLVDYVFDRPVGKPHQKLGGVMVCLGVLAEEKGMHMTQHGSNELKRCWNNMEKIRAKHLAKPDFGSLPGPTQD
jgi:hypothetical protein